MSAGETALAVIVGTLAVLIISVLGALGSVALGRWARRRRV